jgi:ABC-type transport system involved in multi-copper enzyme maturation permease subunit
MDWWSGGERLRGADVAAAAGFQWKLSWQRRKLRGALLLQLLPVVFALLVAGLKLRGRVDVLGTDALSMLLATFYLQILLVVVPLLFGTGLVTRDAEARTLAYLLVRPLSRGSLLAGKFLGSWAAASLALCVSLGLCAVLLLGADRFQDAGPWLGRLPRTGLLLVLGALAYGTLFTLVGLVFPRPALVGLFLAFGWEAAIPWLPGWIKMLTVRHHLAALLPRQSLPSGLLSALDPPSVASGLAWLLIGSVVGLWLAIWVFARRDYP